MTDLPTPSLRPPGPMIDTFGRVARDLRVSVTDRCNLRCTYCMPADGLPWLPKPDMLTDDELFADDIPHPASGASPCCAPPSCGLSSALAT